uniref:hypothetical protein n=1 Tax=Roseburia hominis TaxID=301301 RepID=UPI003FF0D0A9
MIKESDIQNYLYARNIPYTDHASIYAVILPKYSFMRTMMATMLEVQHFVIHFGRTGISVIVVNDLTGRLDPYGFLFFPGGENSERAVFPAGDARSACDPADGRCARLPGE